MNVSIITPTTGSNFLRDCIKSVRSQSYGEIQHLVVVDGDDHLDKCSLILESLEFPRVSSNESLIKLPYSTGKNRYNGHRIYGACTFIAEGEYHIWLDEDNMLESNHVESLVNLVSSKNLDWAFSLRKIIDRDSNFVCLDDCESLGLWPSCLHESDFFVDVNCYFVKKSVAVAISPVWYRKFREPGQIEIDRLISKVLMDKSNNLTYDCTRDYTVKYRVGNTDLSVQSEFFISNNQLVLSSYSGQLPWKK